MSESAQAFSQTDVANHFGVDRTTVRAWQQKGLPYTDNGKGKPATFSPSLTAKWRLGMEVGKEYQINTDNPLTALCFGYALDFDEYPHTASKNKSGRTWTRASLLADMQKCMDVSAEDFHQTFGYCLAVIRQNRGQDC